MSSTLTFVFLHELRLARNYDYPFFPYTAQRIRSFVGSNFSLAYIPAYTAETWLCYFKLKEWVTFGEFKVFKNLHDAMEKLNANNLIESDVFLRENLTLEAFSLIENKLYYQWKVRPNIEEDHVTNAYLATLIRWETLPFLNGIFLHGVRETKRPFDTNKPRRFYKTVSEAPKTLKNFFRVSSQKF